MVSEWSNVGCKFKEAACDLLTTETARPRCSLAGKVPGATDAARKISKMRRGDKVSSPREKGLDI